MSYEAYMCRDVDHLLIAIFDAPPNLKNLHHVVRENVYQISMLSSTRQNQCTDYIALNTLPAFCAVYLSSDTLVCMTVI